MQEPSNAETLERSLCAVAEADVDITPLFFSRVFAAYPDQRANFYHPGTSFGAMVNEIIESVIALANDANWVPSSVQNLVMAHRSFGEIPFDLYSHVLDMVIITLAEVAGPSWTPAFTAAWEAEIARLKTLIAESI